MASEVEKNASGQEEMVLMELPVPPGWKKQNARCGAEGQTQTEEKPLSVISNAPGKEKSPLLDDGGTGFMPCDDDGVGGGGGDDGDDMDLFDGEAEEEKKVAEEREEAKKAFGKKKESLV